MQSGKIVEFNSAENQNFSDMAIRKTATNIKITVHDAYHLNVGKKVEKIAQRLMWRPKAKT
ncbi:hypothetical protein EJ377_04270 [Chryseobacterium arthrosphaerae]|uniref:Uncharacterized protein n=1 Tax=Chryseobacterium arthrosphaerae TaxID=651561 RepID=A0A3S0QI80_9FLAO|nr:hypothetical protein EJ377_04270 [Chryseobacterium arthrosphaerae]